MQLLARRQQLQMSTINACKAFKDFSFTDSSASTGITFTHQPVEDAGKNYQAAHYDHGNGLAAADVDADGWVDLLFLTQLGENQLWKNSGGNKFENITTQAGIGMRDQISVGAAFGDIDNDGLPDLIVTTVRHGNRFFKNQGGGKFEDQTKSSGLGYSGHSAGVHFADFDLDGNLDVVVANVGVFTADTQGPGGFYRALPDAFHGHRFPSRTERSHLYRNLGNGTFEEIGRQAGLPSSGWFGDILVSDLNSDRLPDLYFLNMQGDDVFLENLGGGRFADRTPQYFQKTPWGSTGGKIFDANGDGLLDVLVTDMHSDMTKQQTTEAEGLRPDIEKRKSEAYCTVQWTEEYLQGSTNNIFGNAFYVNQGGKPLLERSDGFGLETYWPWGVSSGDLNADGFTDLFVTAGMGYPFRYAINSVLLNDGGTRFYDAEFVLGIEPRLNGRLGKIVFRLDCAEADKENPLCKDKTGPVEMPGSLSTRSSVILDIDRDGDLDIVTNEFADRPQVFVNNLTQRTTVNYLAIQLMGTKSNRHGVGGRVQLRAGGGRVMQYVDSNSGYLSQSLLPLYFGLGGSKQVEEVTVEWPSGRNQRIRDVKPKQLLKITEPNEP